MGYSPELDLKGQKTLSFKEEQGSYYLMNGGERGIRTPGTTFGSTHDFQSCSFSQLGHLSTFFEEEII